MTTDSVGSSSSARWWRIIVPAILVNISSYMDRTNIGFAMAGGMNESLNITASVSGLAAGIFFVGFMLLQAPGGHFAEHGSAKKFITISVVGWALCSILCGFVQGPTQLLIMRFLLGVCEGGLWPAIMVILTHWFANEERAQANAYFTMSIAVASIITGPISGWIIDTFSWRWVFIVEGLLTLFTITIWYPMITDRPEQASWLGEEEQRSLSARLRAEQVELKAGVGRISYGALMASWRLWQLVAIYFFFIVGIYGFAMWLPSILKSLTKTGMTSVGLLSMFPYIAMVGGLYLFSRLSDRSGNRKLWMAVPIVLFAVSFFLSTVCKDVVWLSYLFLVLSGAFTQSPSCTFWAIPPQVFPAEVAGGARGIINALGNLGGLLGSYAVGWCVTYFGNYDAGIYFVVAALVICFGLILTLPDSLSGKPVAAGGMGGELKHG